MPLIHVFRDLLHAALLREEDELASIGTDRGPARHFLHSVAHADELAIQYLVRKEALRRRIALEVERRRVDLCLMEGDHPVASLQLKKLPVCELTNPRVRRAVTTDIETQIDAVDMCADRYNGWVLIEATRRHAPEFNAADVGTLVHDTVRGFGFRVVECALADVIRVNPVGGDSYSDGHGHIYRQMWPIVFRAGRPTGDAPAAS
jgi:hypothetical protein